MSRLTKRANGISHSMSGNLMLARCENCTRRMPSCYKEDCTAEIEEIQKLHAYEQINEDPAYLAADLAELAHYRELKAAGRQAELPCAVGDLLDMLSDLTAAGEVDNRETYTTGYRNGYRNGRIQLLKYILQIPDGTQGAAEQALKECEQK